jgi:large subunit ribosomal protein L29
MKKRDKETIKNLSDEELKSKLNDLRKKYFQLKFKRNSAPLENPLELRIIRRQISMMKTWLFERETQKSSN